MPGLYSPTITTNVEPPVEIKMIGDLTYAEFQMALGAYNYKASKLYVNSPSYDQVLQRLKFRKYDVSGNIEVFVITPAIDSYQFQSALNIDLENKGVIFDGQLTMDLLLNANETVIFIFDVKELSTASLAGHSVFSFFDNYTDLS